MHSSLFSKYLSFKTIKLTRTPVDVLSPAGLIAGLGGGGGRGLGGVSVVEAVQPLRRAAVKVKPPVAHENLLVENGSVGTQYTEDIKLIFIKF